MLSSKAQYKDALQKRRVQFLKKGTNRTKWHIKNAILRVPVPQLFNRIETAFYAYFVRYKSSDIELAFRHFYRYKPFNFLPPTQQLSLDAHCCPNPGWKNCRSGHTW